MLTCRVDSSGGLLDASSPLVFQFLCLVKCVGETGPFLQPAFLFVDQFFCFKDRRLIDRIELKGRRFVHHRGVETLHIRFFALKGLLKGGDMRQFPGTRKTGIAGNEQVYGQSAERNSGRDANVECRSAENRSSHH